MIFDEDTAMNSGLCRFKRVSKENGIDLARVWEMKNIVEQLSLQHAYFGEVGADMVLARVRG